MNGGLIKRYTTHLNLGIPNFDRPLWGRVIERALETIDASINAATGLTNVRGVWDNATEYFQGERVVDESDGSLWIAQVDHITPDTGTFAYNRGISPQLWRQITNLATYRGEWTPDTNYLQNEFVYFGYRFGVVAAPYTSGVSFDQDVIDNHIDVLMDFTDIAEQFEDSYNDTINARNAAQLAQQNAEIAEDEAKEARQDAIDARNAAELAETNSETAEANAELAEANAELAEANAESARDIAVQAANNATTMYNNLVLITNDIQTQLNNADALVAAVETIRDNTLSIYNDSVAVAAEVEADRAAAQTSAFNAAQSEDNAESYAMDAYDSEQFTNAARADVIAAMQDTIAALADAEQARTGAETAETNAELAEDNAALSASNAATSATNADIARVGAETAEDNAVAVQNNVYNARDDAIDAAELAEAWAVNPENSSVDGTRFSAFHWSEKARQAAGAVTGDIAAAILAGVAETELTNGDRITLVREEGGLGYSNWLNVKASIKGYTDTLYSVVGHTHAQYALTSHTHSDLAPLASPALTGTPTAPTGTGGGTQIATQAYVQNAIAVLTQLAPDLLNTFDEIANALGDDPNFAATMTSQLAGKIDKLADPNADRILFWDDSAGTYAYLALGTGLSISGTTLNGASPYTLPQATESAVGGVELATPTETLTGTDNTRAVTPAGVMAAFIPRSAPDLAVSASASFALYVGSEKLSADQFGLYINKTIVWLPALSDWRISGSNAANILPRMDGDNLWTGAQRGSLSSLTSGTSIALFLANGNDYSLTLAHNASIAGPGDIANFVGQKGTIVGQQDATGGRTLSFGVLWFPIGSAAAPAIPTAPNAKFRIDYHVVSSTRIDFSVSGVGV